MTTSAADFDVWYRSSAGINDLWIFIDGELAIDLGGQHDSPSATVDAGSNFRVDTTMSFTDCGTVTPDLI